MYKDWNGKYQLDEDEAKDKLRTESFYKLVIEDKLSNVPDTLDRRRNLLCILRIHNWKSTREDGCRVYSVCIRRNCHKVKYEYIQDGV